MKVKIISLIFFVFCASVQAQQPNFEGVITYATKISSKLDDVSAVSWSKYLLMGDSVTVYFKNGFYKQVYPMVDVYYIPEKQKSYYRYKGIDSLFYLEYAFDSTEVLSVNKFNSISYINKLPCNKLEITTDKYTITYEYSPSLHLDPTYDTNNTGERYDEYIKIAQAVYLSNKKETSVYSHSLSASTITQQKLPDSIFALPALPTAKYEFESIGTLPQFKGGLVGYRRFLEKNLNGNLAAKYVEKEGFQKVRLQFVITEDGKVADVRAINRKEVHPFLADDAEKVMSKVPRLTPATQLGKKVPFVYVASVTYANTQ